MSKKKNWKRYTISLAAMIVVAIISYGLNILLSQQTYWVEYTYARKVYPVLAQAISCISSIFPFSLAEAIVVMGSVAVLYAIGYTVLRCIRQREAHLHLLKLVTVLCACALAVWLLFSSWSLLYHRLPLGDQLGLQVQESSSEELTALCEKLVEQANTFRSELNEDAAGYVQFPESQPQMLAKVLPAYKAFSAKLPWVQGRLYCCPKGILLSPLMNYTQIVGMYIPITAEPNINTAIPPTSLLVNACHEAAHQRGYAREDEANYLAYRVCMASEDPYYMYSGTYLALLHSMNALSKADKEAFRQLRARYSPGVDRDFCRERSFWEPYKGPVADAADAMNDRYLRSNAQSDGVQSYGRMVDLLLAEMRGEP